MENMQYAEELVREFIIFRGFTNTLQVFERELSTDVGRSFQVDKLMELIFSVYVPKYQSDKLICLLNFFKQCFSSSSDIALVSALSKLELSILRYYIVHALQSGRPDKVVEFFSVNGNYLLQRREEWLPWFAVPYSNKPSLDPYFSIYFSKDWLDMLQLSLHNFLSEIFNGNHILNRYLNFVPSSAKISFLGIPALLKISTEKNTIKRLKTDIKQLNQKLSQLQALLETKEADILSLKSIVATVPEASKFHVNNKILLMDTGNSVLKEVCQEASNSNHLYAVDRNDTIRGNASDSVTDSPDLTVSNAYASSISSDKFSSMHAETNDASKVYFTEIRRDTLKDDEFPEVSVDFQETFLGHTSPISRCRFSASGSNVASASIDGTVRIWTYGSSTPTSRNATIYCGAEIMSLEWERRSDRLLLIGTAEGGIKAWNVDAKRVVCDLNTMQEFSSVIDLKCSPVEPIFVSAAASRRQGFSKMDQLGFASLTVWNMKTWKAMATLPLGKDAPAITSLSFNHNGKILAASATDGMIHMFDMSSGLQITGWPAHDSAVSSVLFGPDETSIFSLGSDGKIFEWSLQNQGQVLWSRDCGRFCHPESEKVCRHELAVDSNGRRLLATSGSVRSPIYQVQADVVGFKTLAHTAAITSVDWHPTLPIFITGSADHSVRVTSLM